MKLPRKRWLLAAIAVLCIGLGYWVHAINQPLEIRFTGMRQENGNVVATFEVENRSDRSVYFQNAVALHGDRKDHMFMRPAFWAVKEAVSGLSYVAPYTTAELKVPLKSASPEESGPVAPFRMEVFVYNLRSDIWNQPPLRWLPARLKPPLGGSIWSERVNP